MMFNPGSTYRLQFHKDFTFADLERIIPYLQQLGIQTIYASPIFQAVPGSMHGYDCIDPAKINPEIGTPEELRNCIHKLKNEGIGWIQDIVPNHMAFHPGNKWLMDVLEKGRTSAYAHFFDILWEQPVFDGKLMVPFLGDTLETVIDKGELHISYENQQLYFCYFDSIFPLNFSSYKNVLHDITHEAPATKEQLAHWLADEKNVAHIKQQVEKINADKKAIQRIADQQYYALCNWRETDKQINYRRFFTVNGLICLRMEDKNVFDQYHRFIKELLDEGLFDGLRVDHVDGLYDPLQYLERLRTLAGPDKYIIVEKILAQGEHLPGSWPVQGNTGYDFLAWVNNLFTTPKAMSQLTTFYDKLVKQQKNVPELLREKKQHILFSHMAGELDNLYSALLKADHNFSQKDPVLIKKAIAALLVACPVYRYYGNHFPLSETEINAIDQLFETVKKENPELYTSLLAIQDTITGKTDTDADSGAVLHFYKRCMQLTGPLMAKGMEDTLMYTYNRFIGHNEVGDTPASDGMKPEHFHNLMIERQDSAALSLNATATHDTKRGEDVRARLNVLTDLPKHWIKKIKEWRAVNKHTGKNELPDDNDAYFIYQSIVGSFPLGETNMEDYAKRLDAYMQKALREAKTNSDWAAPNEKYEQKVHNFISSLLDENNASYKSMQAFVGEISDAGIVQSLAQVLIKYTAPGVPDLYQGCELWDYSFVDPDNRRAVDYELRQEWLTDIIEQEPGAGFLSELWAQRTNGKIKLFLTHKLLALRKHYRQLFEKGNYIALETKGKYKEHILAFARQEKDDWVIVVVPLHIASLASLQGTDVASVDWENTSVRLPVYAPQQWQSLCAKKELTATDKIVVKDIFKELPIAILSAKQVTQKRKAGVLLHITSLPSEFGIGDMGPEAVKFADFLNNSAQSYWQLLPLNPTVADNAYSPYSSISAMAGNILLISPECLAEEGLLTKDELDAFRLPPSEKIDFEKATAIKEQLLEKAYKRFRANNDVVQTADFNNFVSQKSGWLDDFACFVILKKHEQNKPWYEWSSAYKNRDQSALHDFSGKHADEINEVKWQQYVFFKQWKSLRRYCNNKGIQLFGDLPFYISHDSADIWAHPGIFCLDEDGGMTGVAGVPPDYFSADGQLWGMPTYNWHALKESGYDWWIARLRKNLELFDLLRLDHFRAFASYWQVPASAQTARHGQWHDGPGIDFFKVVEKELGGLPFVAEDLGDNMEKVYQLRDEIPLPGMRVLQFAFGTNMAVSVDIPHNYKYRAIVYTGTHDNNTTLGWYREETKKADHKRMKAYAGVQTNKNNVHEVMSKLAYASVAAIAILPLQDILGLDEDHRMNTPGTDKGNWCWRFLPGQLTTQIEKRLSGWAHFYNRV